MDIIQYLLSIIQYLYQQNCWLINFICRYLPLKQWAFEDSHSPKYQKFKIDELPLLTDFRQDWTYKDLIPYFEKRYGKKIRPVSRRSECDIPDDCSCPRCKAPKPFLYRNNGSKGQLLCKICAARFSPSESRFSSLKLRCPHCGHTLVPKKDRKHFILHKCVNPKCPYYLHNLKKVDKADLKEDYGKNKYKLHYIYREFTMDFFRMDLNTLPKNASSLKFSKHNAHVMSLCLTLHINLGLSLRKTSQALKDLYNIQISHQQIANYCKTAAICVKPFVDQYPYRKGEAFVADETYIKVRGIKTYVWLIMNAACRSIIGYQVSDNRGVGPCILAMRMAFQGLKKLPENFKFIADGYSAYPLAAMEFAKKFGKDFTFQITQVIGLTNDDAVSKEYRPFKQIIERLNRTYKASYRKQTALTTSKAPTMIWLSGSPTIISCAPHKHNHYNVLNEVEMLQGADNMPGKWQLLIFLGQQTILNMQKKQYGCTGAELLSIEPWNTGTGGAAGCEDMPRKSIDRKLTDDPLRQKRGSCALFLPSGEDGSGQSPIMGQGMDPLRVLRAAP